MGKRTLKRSELRLARLEEDGGSEWFELMRMGIATNGRKKLGMPMELAMQVVVVQLEKKSGIAMKMTMRKKKIMKMRKE